MAVREDGTKDMAGYCIGLFKYMRIDENLEKKEKLIDTRRNIIDFAEENTPHEKFLSYGEFDRIGFERVEKFSKFRDISENFKIWMGDRQTLLAYDILDREYEDAVYYEGGNFFVRKEDKQIQSDQLFLGITILQFKNSQKNKQSDMRGFLVQCKKNILELVKEERPAVKCSVLGTMGSYGLIIIWLADQYCDVLHMVTRIRNTDIGNENLVKNRFVDNKSIFLSAYTIFAQNHRFGLDWDKKIKEIKGEASLHITLKRGLSDKILDSLKKWQIENTEIYHSAGEHDVAIRVKSADAFNLFSDGGDLNSKSDFVSENVLQTNLQLYENIQESDTINFLDVSEIFNENRNAQDEQLSTLPELEEIQNRYKELREKFKGKFPSTAGMVDTLDWLYSDYIAKISTASNELWVSNFSYQFQAILKSLLKIVANYDKMGMLNTDVLHIINDLLSDFERQISHIAESNNLILGTPICQFRYSGQNNLTLYAYFGLIKNILKSIYLKQEVSSQSEIVPLIVADIVPIIKSKLFIDNYNKDDARVVTINLPMMALYNPVCYYPYLLHEIFHYVVPKDRYIRNEILERLVFMEMMSSICKSILLQKLQFKTEQEKEQLNILFKACVLRCIYSFMLKYHRDYLVESYGKDATYRDMDEKSRTADEYVKERFDKWLKWINVEENIEVCHNPIYLFCCELYNNREKIGSKLKKWEKVRLEQGGDFKSSIEGIIKLLDSFEGIANNSVPDSRESNFRELLSMVGEEIFESAINLTDTVKEALVDVNMVTAGGMDVAEYLLQFTKIRKELLLDCECSEVSTQDTIRLGIVLDYLCKEKDDDLLTRALDNYKETFIDMYCGLNYSVHKMQTDDDFVFKLIEEAKKWFGYWKNCYQKYMLCYRIYAACFRELQEQLLNVADGNERTNGSQESIFWKKYTEALKDYGNYIRCSYAKRGDVQWKEKKAVVDNRIFNINIELIHEFQSQESFADINEQRLKKIEEMGVKAYDKNITLYDKLKLTRTSFMIGKIKKSSHQWIYGIEDVGQLGQLTATIAEELKNSSDRLLGQNEYPVWYRGQQSADYEMIPSIMRKYKQQKAKQIKPEKFTLVNFIKREFEEFRFRADGAQETVERVGYTEGDYIALMQHYSVASNFLDWTEDALSALYFALEGFLDEKVAKTDTDAVLYVFSPALYNHARRRMILEKENDKRKLNIEKDIIKNVQEGIPNLAVSFNDGKYDMFLLGKDEYEDDNSTPYSSLEERDRKLAFYLPIAIYIPRLNKRIQMQDGMFLAYNIYTSPDDHDGFDYISLEEIQDFYFRTFAESSEEVVCPFLYKIIIKKEAREKVAKWVKAFGMSKEKCYPELCNVGERIMK